MRLASLYNKHTGQDIFVIGSGPSLRVFPTRFFKDKVTIGLNQAWRHFRTTYTLSVHPELLLEFEKERSAISGQRVAELVGKGDKRFLTQWIVKRKGHLGKASLDDPRYYMFDTKGDDLNIIRQRPTDVLFLAKGIQCTALDLAARMGARTIYLVGVDLGPLAGDHHGHDQHVRFNGNDPADSYKEMRHWAALARRIVRDEFKIDVLVLSTLLGAGAADEDYQRLCVELGLAKLPPPQDTSTYIRLVPKELPNG